MSFFLIPQNNSGGRFTPPAKLVCVETDSFENILTLTSPYFTFCGDSGFYAEYDVCGCCPCCGHRWVLPWSDEPASIKAVTESLEIYRRFLEPGVPRIALIYSNGSILIGDTEEKIEQIKNYISNASEPRQITT